MLVKMAEPAVAGDLSEGVEKAESFMLQCLCGVNVGADVKPIESLTVITSTGRPKQARVLVTAVSDWWPLQMTTRECSMPAVCARMIERKRLTGLQALGCASEIDGNR